MDQKTFEEAFAGLIADNLMLRAQFMAQASLLRTMVYSLSPTGNPKEAFRKFDDEYRKNIAKVYDELLVSHPYMEQSWKERMKKELGDIPGLALEE